MAGNCMGKMSCYQGCGSREEHEARQREQDWYQPTLFEEEDNIIWGLTPEEFDRSWREGELIARCSTASDPSGGEEVGGEVQADS